MPRSGAVTLSDLNLYAQARLRPMRAQWAATASLS